MGHCQLDPGLAAGNCPLIVLAQPSAASQPAESPLDHPAALQDVEPGSDPLNDLQEDRTGRLPLGHPTDQPLVHPISPRFLLGSISLGVKLANFSWDQTWFFVFRDGTGQETRNQV